MSYLQAALRHLQGEPEQRSPCEKSELSEKRSGVRLPGLDGEPCPLCQRPLTGSTCWRCMGRVCAGCGRFAGSVLYTHCPACRRPDDGQ